MPLYRRHRYAGIAHACNIPSGDISAALHHMLSYCTWLSASIAQFVKTRHSAECLLFLHHTASADIDVLPRLQLSASFASFSAHCQRALPMSAAYRGSLTGSVNVFSLKADPVSAFSECTDSMLIFIQFKEAMKGLQERWWFRPDENDAELKRFNRHESKAHLKVPTLLFSTMCCNGSAPSRKLILHKCSPVHKSDAICMRKRDQL